MKRITIFTLLFLIITVFYSIGQEKRVSIGLASSIEFNDYNFEESGSTYNSTIGYSIGFDLQYLVFDKLLLKSGINYSTQGYELKHGYIFHDTEDPFIPRESKLKVSCLRIPIMVGYQIYQTGKISFAPSIGLRFGFQINENESTIFEDNSERETTFLTDDLNKNQILANLNLAFNYNLNGNFKISIEPFIGKALIRLNENTMSSGQFSYGGFLGLYYRL